jgi:uncharacterized protein (TIGR03437 family)
MRIITFCNLLPKLSLLLICSVLALAERIITTVAGSDLVFRGDGRPAMEASLGRITGVTVGPSGDVYVVDEDHNLVALVSPNGSLTVVAGNGFRGFSGDGGPAITASLDKPRSVAVDAAGNRFVADTENHRIRHISPDGTIRTFAGNGIPGSGGDTGPAINASLQSPVSVAFDTTGNLYIADSLNHRIRKVSPDGIIRTIAGNGIPDSDGDNGPAIQASLKKPQSVTVDATGNLFIADSGNHRIRKVSSDGIIRTVAGGGPGFVPDDVGPATDARLANPLGVAVDGSGNLFIAEAGKHRIRQVSPDGTIRTIAGNELPGFSGDGVLAITASINKPHSVAVDSAGNLFLADTENHRIRKVSPDGNIQTVVGSGSRGSFGDGGPATNAFLWQPVDIAVDRDGNMFIADSEINRIRKVSVDRTIQTVAGSGLFGFTGDNRPATSASLNRPRSVAVDSAGNLFIADTQNVRIRKVNRSDGIIQTVAGNGECCFWKDGVPATEAVLARPEKIAVDAEGNLFIAAGDLESLLPGTLLIRRVNRSDGIIETVAGNGNPGFSGDGGPATATSLHTPRSIAVDSAGNLFIADTFNVRIRKVNLSDGIIQTVAGNGVWGLSGDGGLATNSPLTKPEDVAVDSAGNLFIAETESPRVRQVSRDGIIRTIAGNGISGFRGDGGPAVEAFLANPQGITADTAGNLFIADTGNRRVRIVLAEPPLFDPLPVAEVSLSGQSSGVPVTAEGAFVSASGLNAPLVKSVARMSFSATVGENHSWLSITPTSGATPRLVQIVADPGQLAPGEYNGTVTITMPNAQPSQRSVAVLFTVGSAEPPELDLDQQRLDFTYSLGAVARTQTLVVANKGGGQLDFTASVELDGGGGWLSLSDSAGTATPSSPVALAVIADPANLPEGTYTGKILISTALAADPVKVPVDMTVTASDQVILLSQTGFTFTAVADGGVVPSQSFGVLNVGSGVMQWSISTDVPDGGDWLKFTPANGSTDAAATVPSVEISIDQSGLAPGPYYGVIIVSAPAAANKAQVITVFLEILPVGSNPGSVVDPPELVFTAPAGAAPGSQEVFVYNISATSKTFRAVAGTDDGGSWLQWLPGEGQLDPSAPSSVVVQPFTSALSAGEHTGALTFQFSDGRVQEVPIRVTVSGGGGTTDPAAHRVAGACRPEPALTSQVMNRTAKAGWPVALQAKVIDDCGQPMSEGTVYVRFSNGDPELELKSLNNGIWEATWTTSVSAAPVTLRVTAENLEGFKGSKQISLNLTEAIEKPSLTRKGIVSAASLEPSPLAPGGFVSIFGDRLSLDGQMHEVGRPPLPTNFSDTHVFITGGPGIGLLELPLSLLSDGDEYDQINGIVPDIVPPNTIHQIYVRRGKVRSQPVYVTVAESQPAVFQLGNPPPTAPRQGHIYEATTGALAGPASPASEGDVIVLWCSGLGPTNPPVPAGTAAPFEELARTVNNVKIMIGGVEATVVFSGLSPGLANLYQINAIVPAGVAPGDQVDVQLEVAGQKSPKVTMAVD